MTGWLGQSATGGRAPSPLSGRDHMPTLVVTDHVAGKPIAFKCSDCDEVFFPPPVPRGADLGRPKRHALRSPADSNSISTKPIARSGPDTRFRTSYHPSVSCSTCPHACSLNGDRDEERFGGKHPSRNCIFSCASVMLPIGRAKTGCVLTLRPVASIR